MTKRQLQNQQELDPICQARSGTLVTVALLTGRANGAMYAFMEKR